MAGSHFEDWLLFYKHNCTTITYEKKRLQHIRTSYPLYTHIIQECMLSFWLCPWESMAVSDCALEQPSQTVSLKKHVWLCPWERMSDPVFERHNLCVPLWVSRLLTDNFDIPHSHSRACPGLFLSSGKYDIKQSTKGIYTPADKKHPLPLFLSALKYIKPMLFIQYERYVWGNICS